MSNRSASVGGTLTGGIQDVAALLPLIGTEQCEKHVGSALAGGYLYAAATPLSIFGSLGIVKGGIAILISSLSVPVLYISISFFNYKPSVELSSQRRWLGGKVLKDAGFELTGSVAPLIGMDGERFKAETRLIEMLEEKHIDDPEKVSVNWKSQKWNIMLVLSTLVGAMLSVTPYIALLLGPASWKPSSVHLPWLFPALRIVGSCTAIVACQFIIQSRVISLMKNRLLFMTIHQKLQEIHADKFDAWLKDSNIKWDVSLPAEQCIWSLEQHISSVNAQVDATCTTIPSKSLEKSSGHSLSGTPEEQDHIAIAMNGSVGHAAASPALSPETPNFKIEDLRTVQHQHFPTPLRDTAFITLSWFFLLASLPATVAGYIGCFTLVSATPSPGNGPLVWVGLEAALSLLRILVWASNPAFDEETEVTLKIKLSEHQPIVTTHDYNPSIFESDTADTKPFALIPEREFLEHITPYTGPLDQFQKPDNITLYFTLSAEYEYELSALELTQTQNMCVIMTVFDSDMQIGVSLTLFNKSFHYIDVVVKYDTISRQLEAKSQSAMRDTRPWRMEDDGLFDSLESSYSHIIEAISQQNSETTSATLLQKWDLSRKLRPDTQAHNVRSSIPTPRLLSSDDVVYLDRGYEHHLKTKLIATWSEWISMDMENLRAQGKIECWEALRDATSEKGVWELTELDWQLVWGWTQRELSLVKLSMDLEGILGARMSGCVSQVVDVRKDQRLRTRMNSEFERMRRKRMEQERGAARKRMEDAMKNASEQADKEERPWPIYVVYSPQWTWAIEFIDRQWSLAVSKLQDGLKGAEDELGRNYEALEERRRTFDEDRSVELQNLRQRVSHERWRDHEERFGRQMAEATLEGIRNLPTTSTRDQLARAYRFPEADEDVTAKFVYLRLSSSQGKACSALVYDAESCPKEIVCDIIAKSTTRSMVEVDPDIVTSIPPNEHLLFLSCRGGEGQEPVFVQQNRDRWPTQQTEHSSIFYFTPYSAIGHSCWVRTGKTIAHILVFLISPCSIHISLIHKASRPTDKIRVSLQTNHTFTELAKLELSNISDTFQLHDFPPFVLPEGRHELILVPQYMSETCDNHYHLRDIVIRFSPIITTESSLVQVPGIPGISDPKKVHVSESPMDSHNQIESG